MAESFVLLLRLAGPLQSWGSASRFTRRGTDPQPTKSGIVGLLAAAEGRRREDPIEDLSGLRLEVRVERPGVLIGDFQTARRPLRGGGSGDVSMPLSTRYYLSDAVFLAAIEGPEPLIRGLEEATRRPRFALALGRRSCPPAGQFLLGVAGGSLEEALSAHSWLGRPVRTSRAWQPPERLLVVRDLGVDEDLTGAEREHDVPLSFDPRQRKFGWRWVRREWINNPESSAAPDSPPTRHDAFSEVG